MAKKTVAQASRTHIRTGDTVLVISGGGRSKTPRKVLGVLPREGKVLVEGVNMMKDSQKHDRQGAQADINQQNFIEKPYPIDVSNVALADPKTGKATRMRLQKHGDGKQRVAVKSGQTI
jgi:large subunit ribosomal protein L24